LRCDAFAQSHPERKSFIERAVQRQQCLVAESDGQVAGFAVLHHEFFEQPFISLVVVAVEFRRRGIALQLLRAVESACGSSKLFSSTNASNLPAQELLRKAGFSRSGVVENLDPGDAEYIYFKEARANER
jgi:ribosomal protein S18 acetylase RimI-like enzyme